MAKEFQNILCWSLSMFRIIMLAGFQISKHLMLKFIPYHTFFLIPVSTISKHLMLKFIGKSGKRTGEERKFQNILCWSLSRIGLMLIPFFLSFQNILCWSLSISRKYWHRCLKISKHLMLKFIALIPSSTASYSYFKTSYVEVYPFRFPCFRVHIFISKHLMLKFIEKANTIV